MAIKVVKLAEARNLLQGKWDNERLDLLEKFYNEVKEFTLCEMSVSLFVYDSGTFELHNTELRIQDVPFKITLVYLDKYKKYYVFADFKELPNIDNYAIENAKKGIAVPNFIGKLSEKKLNDWIAYHTAVYNILKADSEANGNEKEKFLKSIEGLPVKWNDDKKKSGSIVQNGIELTFEIGTTYVSKRMQLHYTVLTSVENFKTLSNNKFQGKQ